jgi:phage baseplate assembly protein gpV
MNHKSAFALVPALALGTVMLGAAPAMAASSSDSSSSFQAQLHALNKSGGTGTAWITLNGNRVTVKANVSGLAEKFGSGLYPHVAHIHDMGAGECPMPSADKNNDQVVSTPEGAPAYGGIASTLTSSGDTSPKSALDVKRAFGNGGHFTYTRTFTLDAATVTEVKKDNAVIVVHGLDPATLSKKAQKEDSSPLTKDLPLAATAPALCGPLHASQMSMPNGAAGTGGGTSDQGSQAGLLALGGSMILAAGAAVVVRRRVTTARAGR